MNAVLAVALLVFIMMGAAAYGRSKGYKLDEMGPAITGGLLLYFVISLGFWFMAQLGWWSFGFSASQVSVDDKFQDTFSSIVSRGMLNSDGMGDIELSDSSYTNDVSDANPDGIHNHSSSSPVDAIDPDAAVVEVVKPTPTPVPTPVKYRQNVDKPVTAWAKWFVDNSYNREAVNLSNIPAGVRCRVIKTGKKGWFSGQNVWTARCADPNNPDYGTADIQLTERAYSSLGIKSDDAVIIGTGMWPKGYFEQDDQQSQAPASAPGPAPVANPVVAATADPEVLARNFTSFLVVDAPAGIPCIIGPGGANPMLKQGEKYRIDPKSIQGNSNVNDIPRVEVLINRKTGATCWAQLWPGLSHAQSS